LDVLEDRTAPSITWVNRGTPTDTFTAAERRVVDAAIGVWNGVRIPAEFDYSKIKNQLNME